MFYELGIYVIVVLVNLEISALLLLVCIDQIFPFMISIMARLGNVGGRTAKFGLLKFAKISTSEFFYYQKFSIIQTGLRGHKPVQLYRCELLLSRVCEPNTLPLRFL